MNLQELRAALGGLDHLNDEQVTRAYATARGINPDRDPNYAKMASEFMGYDRSAGDMVSDAAVGLGQGVLGLGKVVGNVAGGVIGGSFESAFDNPMANAFSGWSDDLQRYKSRGLQAQEAGAQVRVNAAQQAAAAEGQGGFGQFVAGAGAQVGNYVTNPGLLAQDLFTNAPQLVAGGVVGRAAQVGGEFAGLGLNAARRLGTGAAVGSGGVMQGADAGSDTYERLIKLGVDPAQAGAMAGDAATRSAVASAGLSLLPGGMSADRMFLRGVGGTAARGRLLGTVRGGLGEFTTEGVDESYGRFAGNQQVQVIDPNQSLMDRVGQAFVQGGAAGGPFGAMGGFREAGHRPQPRTETGDIDLMAPPVEEAPVAAGPAPMVFDANGRPVPPPAAQAGAQPVPGAGSDLNRPAYQRRGLDPFATPAPAYSDLASAPYAGPPEASFVDLMGDTQSAADPFAHWNPAAPAPVQQPGMGPNDLPPVDPFTEWEAAQRAQAGRASGLSMPGVLLGGAGQPIGPQPGTPRPQAPEAVGPVAQPVPEPAGPMMYGTADGQVTPPLDPQAFAGMAAARDAQATGAPTAPPNQGVLNRGSILRAVQDTVRDLNTRGVLKKDGNLAGTRAGQSVADIIEAADPIAAIRAAYQDGAGPRDEFLDGLHTRLTGQKLSQSVETNSAGFVSETPENIAAQAAAVREGRKPALVVGDGDPVNAADVEGLVKGKAVDPTTGATATIYTRTRAEATAAAARANDVGLKQAMGELLNVVDPTVTSSETDPGTVAVQQVDDKSGAVLAEEIVTPENVENVAPIPGTTAKVVSSDTPVRERQEAQAAKPTAKALIDTVENSKDEAQYDEARYQLYKLWNEGDEDASAYLYDRDNKADKSDKTGREGLSRNDITRFQERLEMEQTVADTKRGQELGKKFGTVLESKTSMGVAAQLASSKVRDAKLLGKAAPLADEIMNAEVPPAVKALLVGDGKTNTDGATALKRALTLLAETGPKELRALATDIARLMPATGLSLTVDTKRLVNAHGVVELGPVPHLTLFTADGRRGLTNETVLHEALHAAVAARYYSLSVAVLRKNDQVIGRGAPVAAAQMEQFTNLWHEFQDMAHGVTGLDTETKLSLDEATRSPDEFLVRAMTSAPLQRWMAQQQYKGKTLFERFKDWVKTSLFGFRTTGTAPSWLDAALAATDDLTSAMVNDRADFDRLYAIQNVRLVPQGQGQRSAAGGPEFGGDALFSRAAQSPEPAVAKSFGAATRAYAAAAAQVQGKEISPTLLAGMTMRQIDEQFGKKLPAMRAWITAQFERGSSASALAAKADRTALQWEQSVKSPAEKKAMADILFRASVAELQLDNTDPAYLAKLSVDERMEYDALRKKLAALSPQARAVRRQALDILGEQWSYTRNALESFITHTVADPGERAARIKELNENFGRNRGDYFPLTRFGDNIVIGRSAASDGRDVVSFHESTASADAEVRRLKAEGVKKIDRTMRTDQNSRERAGTGFMNGLHGLIDSADTDGAVKEAMHEALQQLYLKSLPELSGAKHMIRREGVEGFSKDALRVFADAVTRGSRYASHLQYGPQINAAMEAAQNQSTTGGNRLAGVVIGRKDGETPVTRVVAPGTDRLTAFNKLAEDGYQVEFFNTSPETAKERLAGKLGDVVDEAAIDKLVSQVEDAVGRSAEGVEDMRAARGLYNFMVKRTRGDVAYDKDSLTNNLTELAGQVGYTWFLGFSPAFWAMNTLQNPMVGIPHLGAKYGIGKSAGEWMKAMSWFGGVRMGKLIADGKTPFSVDWLAKEVQSGRLKGVSPAELKMLKTLEDHQVLDFTQAMDLSKIGQNSSSKWTKLMRLGAAGAHHTEVFNRVTFALAAYRLALKSNGNVTHEEATRRAEDDMAAVHFDYSSSNKPSVMKGQGPARLVFMFQQYRQHMLYWWAKQMKDMIRNEAPGDRVRAAKAAVLMATTQGLFAGALGMPFVGAIGFAANIIGAAFGSDDEPYDFDQWIQDAAHEQLGKKGGDILAKGIFASMGMNIGQRIGQADLMPFMNLGSAKYERSADDKVRAYLFDMLGPLGSIALGAAKSTEAFERGDVLGGIAATSPKFVADASKALALHNDGLTNKRGQELAGREAFDGADRFMQAAGVTPTSVADIKADRGRLMDVEQKFIDRRRSLLNNFGEAWQRNDRESMAEALDAVRQYNVKLSTGKYAGIKELAISGTSLQSFLQQRMQQQMLLALTGGTAETKRQMLLAMRMSGLNSPVSAESMAGNRLPTMPVLD